MKILVFIFITIHCLILIRPAETLFTILGNTFTFLDLGFPADSGNGRQQGIAGNLLKR
jgi:hypothetical protein